MKLASILLATIGVNLLAFIGLKPVQLCLTPEQQAILDTFELTTIDDGFGNQIPTLRVTGVNLQVVNGLGTTNTTNATGNVIIGYNEFNGLQNDERRGSHNLVLGLGNDYFQAAFGSLVSGSYNRITVPHTAVIASRESQSDGMFSTVIGADEGYVLTPGVFNNVLGGEDNFAIAHHSTVIGGQGNWVNAGAQWGTVGGGRNRTVFTPYDWAAGSLYEFEPDN